MIHKRIFPDTFITAAYRSSRFAAAVPIRVNCHGKQNFFCSAIYFVSATSARAPRCCALEFSSRKLHRQRQPNEAEANNGYFHCLESPREAAACWMGGDPEG